MASNQSLYIVLKLECHLRFYTYPLYGWQKIVHILIPISLALMWLPNVVLNYAALLVYLEKKSRSCISNIFILNTIIADLCTGLISTPLALAYYVLVIYFHELVCPLYLTMTFFGFVFTVVSFLMVSFSAIDRYLAVYKPFFYSAKLAHWSSLYYVIMGITWVFSISIVGSSFMSPNFAPVIYFIVVQPLVVLIHFFMNIKLWIAVRTVREKIRRQIRASESIRPEVYIIGSSKQNENSFKSKGNMHDLQSNNKTNRTFERKKPIVYCNSQFSNQSSIAQYRTSQLQRENGKSTCIMSFMLISLCFCYFPFITIAIIWETAEEDLDIYNTFGTVATTLVVFKSVLNPIIYWYSMSSVKKKLKEVVCCWKKGQLSSRSTTLQNGSFAV